MSKSQKVLKAFGFFEVLIAVYYAVLGLMGSGVPSLVSAVLYLLSSYLLFAAAKDAKKAGGAWLITLIDLIFTVAELGFALNAGAGEAEFIGCIVAIILNLIAFIAANNVKKQGKNA